MTNDKATALREAAERATPGGWRVESVSRVVWAITNNLPDTPHHVVVEDAVGFVEGQHDAAYIALADPPTILALLAERERLREALEAIDALEPMELNPSNYDHDIACEVSRNAACAAVIARQALEATDDQ